MYYTDFDHEIPGTNGYDPDEREAYEAGERVPPPSVEPSAALVFPGLTDEEMSEGLVVFEAGWHFDSPADVNAWDAANLQEHLQGVIYADDRPGYDASVLPDFGKESR